MARSSSGEALLARVMRILESFGPQISALSLTELADRSDLPLATAHRLVKQMSEHGILERQTDGKIRMGTRLWEMANRSSRVGLREAAAPAMVSLHEVVQQHVQLAVLVDDEVLYIERLSTKNAVANIADIARRLPVYASSAGFVFLAFGPVEMQERVLAGPFIRFTSRSVTDPVRLRSIITSTRRLGYATGAGIVSYNSKGVSVPVRDKDGTVAAVLSIAIPIETDHLKYVPMLRAAARSISHAIGAPVASGLETARQFNPLPWENAGQDHRGLMG